VARAWRYRLRRGPRELAVAHSLVAAWGADTLAPFALRADKSYFFSEDDAAFLSYRVVGASAIVAGDPIGPDALRRPLVQRFLDFAHERGWRVAVLGVSERCLDLYASLGLHALLSRLTRRSFDTATFSLEGARSARCGIGAPA